MGSVAILKISTDWSVENIVTILEKRMNCNDVKIRSTNVDSKFCQISFEHNDKNRTISFHYNNKDNTGILSNHLSLGAGDQANQIFYEIAELTGGMFQKNDCADGVDGMFEEIQGEYTLNDGIPYFIRYAMLNGECNKDDMVQLNKSIKDWQNKIDKGRNRMRLFE